MMNEFPREMGGPRKAEDWTLGESVDQRREGLTNQMATWQNQYIKIRYGNSLAVWWIGFHTFTGEGLGSSLVPGELRSHKPCGMAKKRGKKDRIDVSL